MMSGEAGEGGEVIERVSFWLLPAEPQRESLQQIISDLAERFDAPRFEPHVTVFSGPKAADDDLCSIVASVAAGFSAIELRGVGIGHSEQFTRTLFVQFEANEELARLQAELESRSAVRTRYELNPHLSLIYATLTPETKESLRQEFSMLEWIRFDTLAAIASHGKTRTGSDVERWRTVAEAALRK